MYHDMCHTIAIMFFPPHRIAPHIPHTCTCAKVPVTHSETAAGWASLFHLHTKRLLTSASCFNIVLLQYQSSTKATSNHGFSSNQQQQAWTPFQRSCPAMSTDACGSAFCSNGTIAMTSLLHFEKYSVFNETHMARVLTSVT